MFLSKKKKLKTCIFLVNIELGSAPKKMLIFFKRGRGEGERGGRRTKKHAFFWAILNWGARRKNSHFFLKGEKGRKGGKGLYKSV